MFGWKGSSCLFNHLHIPSADVAIVYELVVGPTVISSVVGFTHSQEVGSQVPSYNLASIYKYVSGKQSKRKHSCEKRLKIMIIQTGFKKVWIPERKRCNETGGSEPSSHHSEGAPADSSKVLTPKIACLALTGD